MRHGELLLHRLIETRSVDGVAVNDVILTSGVNDIIVLPITPLANPYRSDRVHGSTCIEGDYAVASGGFEYIDSIVIGDRDKQILLSIRQWIQTYLVHRNVVNAAGVADELLDQARGCDVLLDIEDLLLRFEDGILHEYSSLRWPQPSEGS